MINEVEEFDNSFLDNLAGKWNAIIFESKEDGKLITLKAFEEMIAFDEALNNIVAINRNGTLYETH